MPEPLVSRDDLGARLGEDLSLDDHALASVDAASEICRTVAEQTFNAVEDDEVVLDGTGTDALLLPERPVTAVTTVIEDDEELVVTDDYVLTSNGTLIRLESATYWCPGRQNIIVTYDHGYADADLPRDVRMVALQIATRLYEQGAAVFEATGRYQVRYAGEATDLQPGEKLILRKYKGARSR